MISSFLTHATQLVAFGMFLDTVLIGREERRRIERYLDGTRTDQTLNDRFQNFLSVSHSIVFNRFFSGQLLSLSFFMSAAALSLISFAFVVFIQLYFHPEALIDVEFDFFQISIILAFVAFNVLFDYTTIVQTKIFIEASMTAKSIFRSLVFIISDLIVTLNSFILAYALFILLVVQLIMRPTVEVDIVRAKGPHASLREITEPREISEPPSYLAPWLQFDALSRLNFEHSISALALNPSNPDERDSVAIYYNSTFDPSEIDRELSLLASASRLNVSLAAEFSEITGPDATEIARQVYLETGINRLVRDATPPPDNELPEVERATLVVDDRITSARELNLAYTITFGTTDHLEDGFPASILNNLDLFSLRGFVGASISAEPLQSPIAICFFDDGTFARFTISDATVRLLEHCPDFATMEAMWPVTLARDIGTIGRDLDGRVVPYNTLLITSLLPTAAFYCTVVLLAIVTFLFSSVLRETRRLKTYFLRAPFSITCFLLSIPTFLLGLL